MTFLADVFLPVNTDRNCGSRKFIVLCAPVAVTSFLNIIHYLAHEIPKFELSKHRQMAKTYILVLAFVLLSCLASAGPLHHLHPTNIYSWGNNQYGQLGNGEQSKHQFAQRVKIPALPSSEGPDVDFSFTKIMASNTHVLASTIDKKLYGWGSNCNGALGLTNYTSWRAFRCN